MFCCAVNPTVCAWPKIVNEPNNPCILVFMTKPELKNYKQKRKL